MADSGSVAEKPDIDFGASPVCQARSVDRMAEGKLPLPHHWHHTHTLTPYPGIDVSKCCYCGQERRVTHLTPYTSTCGEFFNQ